MSDYNKITNFTIKDSLPSGNTSKIIKGTEIDNEFNAIQSSISSKADTNSPSFTGTPLAPTASAGTNTTQIATTAFVTSSPTINNANLTGTPVAPTAAAGTNTTQVATTAHVFAERTNTATLTNKTINLTTNTLVATSAQLAAALTDETGSGSAVFGTAPTINNANLTGVPVAPTAAANTNTTQVATTAYVDTKVIATAGIADNAVTTVKINDSAVTTAKLNDASVTADKLASNAVTTVKITDANVTTAKLADNAVTTVKITDSNVTTAKIADSAITTAKLSTGAPSWDTSGNVTVSGDMKFNSGYGSAATVYGCRAWVNFNGSEVGAFAGGTATVYRAAGSNTATVTTSNPHGLETGHTVHALTGLAVDDYPITKTSATTFTVGTSASTLLNNVAATFSFVNIRSSGNVSSVADCGTGKYTVNLTNSMPDTNCCVTTGVSQNITTYGDVGDNTVYAFMPTVNSIYMVSRDPDQAVLEDSIVISAAVFR